MHGQSSKSTRANKPCDHLYLVPCCATETSACFCPHPARNPAPGARASPSVTFERFLSFDLAAPQGRVGRRARGVRRHQPNLGRAKRHRIVSST